MYESEPDADALYDTVFKSPQGRSVLTGVMSAGVVAIPTVVAMSLFGPDVDGRPLQAVQGLRKDISDLQTASAVLEKQGEHNLALDLNAKVAQLSQQMTVAEAQIPSHVVEDVSAVGLLAIPIVIGALVGIIKYRRLTNAA